MKQQAPRVVIITGASSGIGAAVAREAARHRHRLVLSGRRSERLEALAGELKAQGTEAIAVAADLVEPEAPAQITSAAIDHFGGIDVVINNAGSGLPEMYAQSDPDAMRRQLLVNLVAPIVLVRHALPSLKERRGVVINVGSAITCVANPALGAYGAAKAGLAYWNDALRRELWHEGVRVCLVEPGPVTTEFFTAMHMVGKQGGGVYNPLRDPPPPALSAEADEVARRIVRLIEKPRRRLSVLRRVVWPHRVVGAVFQVLPTLGDVTIASMVRHLHEHRLPKAENNTAPTEPLPDAQPAE